MFEIGLAQQRNEDLQIKKIIYKQFKKHNHEKSNIKSNYSFSYLSVNR